MSCAKIKKCAKDAFAAICGKWIPLRLRHTGLLLFIVGLLSVLSFNNGIEHVFGQIMLFGGLVIFAVGVAITAAVRHNIRKSRGQKSFFARMFRTVFNKKNRGCASERSTRKYGDVVRVVFYCDNGSLWNTFDKMYRLMKEDHRFDPVILAAPEMYLGEIEHYKAIDFLEDKGYPYVKGYDIENNKWLDLHELNAEYILYNRHYEARQPRKLSFMSAKECSKICYVPYNACPAKGKVLDTVCGFATLQNFDVVFSENKCLTDIYERYKNRYPACETKIVEMGSPKFDIIYDTFVTRQQVKRSDRGKQTILYAPRWRTTEGTCSFFELYEYFFDLVRNNPDIEYIFRPHPLMSQGVGAAWGEDKWLEFIAEFDKIDNAYIDLSPEYFSSFEKATVMVSDMSSLMFEFQITGKPIVYMYKRDVFNKFGMSASRGFYYCTTVDDVISTLENLRKGEDPMAPIRQRVLQEDYSLCDGLSSNRIIEYLY